MKRLFASVVLLSLCAAATLAAQDRSPWSFHARFDVFDFSLKAGAGYSFSDSFELDGAIGAVIINPLMITYVLSGVSHLMPPDKALQVDVEYGLIQASISVLATDTPSAYWVPGACVVLGYRSPSGHQASIRAGAGVMFGYDLGTWQRPGFQPNLGLEYSWRRP